MKRKPREYPMGDLMEEYNSGQRSRVWFLRQVWSFLWLREQQKERSLMNASGFWNDVRYAARSLRQSPGTSAAALLAIILAVGVNTGIFTLLNAFALRMLPVRAASEVVTIYQILRGSKDRFVHGASSMFSYSEYREYRAQNHVFSGVVAYHPVSVSMAGETPRQLEGFVASCNYFSVLGVEPRLGRGFRPEECRSMGAGNVVVLSDAVWKRVFGADPRVIGKNVVFNRQPLSVVGVAPPGFQGTEPAAGDFWAPVTMAAQLDDPGDLTNANLSWLMLLGRRKPGVSLDQVRADLSVIASHIDHLYPGRSTTLAIHTATFFSNPSYRPFVLSVAGVILAAVTLVLLIACANVANLLLARASARHREIAVRLALGASRTRLIRQLLTESMLLAVSGGALGSALAFWGSGAVYRLLLTHLPPNVPRLALNPTPDLGVLLYSLAITLLTGFVFGLAPALQSTKPDLNAALKDEGAGSGTSRSRSWPRGALVVAQVAVCMILLIAAGLLARGLEAAQNIDPGFAVQAVTVASFDLEQQRYNQSRAAMFHRRLLERVSAIPGVNAVAEATVEPLSGSTSETGIQLASGRKDEINFNFISPSYFSALAIPMVRGRNFHAEEAERGASVAIVTEGTARRLWPNQDPLGKTFHREGELIEVVGVAKDSRTSDLRENDPYFVYFPSSPKDQLYMRMLVHGSGSPAAMGKAIREAARAIDPNLMVETHPPAENLETFRMPARVVTTLSAALAAMALLLSSIGIYSIVSFAVSRRVREIGIRMTLGADARAVRSMVMRGAMRPVVVGVAIGIAGCAAVSRVLSSILFGISPLDPVSFGGVTLFMVAVALLASYLPARRATRVDPMEALRYE